MRLVRGAAGSGKTALVFREFREALGGSRTEARIVVPTATLVRHYQHELARDGVVLPPRAVISLNRFARELTPELKLAPDALLRVIVRDALSRLKPREFDQVAETAGMVSTIVDTITLFGNAGGTADQLAAVRKLSPHGRAFEKIWCEVEAAVHRCGYSTRSEILKSAALNLPPLRVWMDGFVTFSPVEQQFIRALAAHCDLTVTAADTPASDEIRRFVLQLGGEDRLLRGPARKAPITTVAAPSMERECDEIARRTLNQHQSGTPFREMAVALRDPESYLSILRATFERFGIPARFYFSTPLRTHSVARFLNGLIENVLSGWEFGFALQTLRSHPGWGQTAAFDRFDFRVREAMPGRGVEKLGSLCEDDLRSRIWVCFVIEAWREEVLTPAQWKQRLLQMSHDLYRPGLLEPPHRYSSVESARSHVAALRAWNEAVSGATDFFGPAHEPVALGEFWRVARAAVDAVSIQKSDDRGEVVHVMSVYEARQWDVESLFVCGLTDREIPKKNPPNLLFPDGEIDALRKIGFALRKASDQDREEAGLFHSLKGRARGALVLTWPLHDSAGKSVRSSRFVEEIVRTEAKPVLCRATPAEQPATAGIAGRIEAPSLLASLAAQHQKISLSALEDLAQCRFKFFAGRSLGLKGRPERPEQRLQARVKGLILHEALEAWLNLGRKGEFIEVFETTFDKFRQEKHLPPGFLLEVERVFLRAVARGVSATERWTPVSSEAEVELALNFPGGVTVSCRVDRIDRMNERDCIIVDYKSGMTSRVAQLVESKVKLQGPFYALAARETLGLNTIAMMYVAVRDDKPFGWGRVPGADLPLAEMPPRWMEDARDRAIDRLSNLLSGAIQADPVEPENCRWCDFAQACRYTKEAERTEAAHGA